MIAECDQQRSLAKLRKGSGEHGEDLLCIEWLWVSHRCSLCDLCEPTSRYAAGVRLTPTAPVAAASLIVGYAVAVSTGSRPLGGVVLAIGGLWCIQAWRRRHGVRTAAILACVGLGAFAVSHVLALAIGAWPSVLLVSAIVAAVAWTQADARVLSA